MLMVGILIASFPVARGQEVGKGEAQAAEEKWLATKQEIEASGFVFGLEAHTPPAVPSPEDNFAAHPLVAELFTPEAHLDPKSTRLGRIDLRKVPGFPKPDLRLRTEPHRLFDLPRRAGDASLDRDEAARIILKGLDTWKTEFEAVAEAAARPGCSFPFTWERPMVEVSYTIPNAVHGA